MKFLKFRQLTASHEALIELTFAKLSLKNQTPVINRG